MTALLLLTLLAHPALASTDDDGDGVLNTEDACPAIPEDLDGFQDADGCPDPDNDVDGVPDADDRCPGEPEDRDGFEDGDGCPDVDNDGDGLLDPVDPCPDKAGPQGCPADTDATLVPFDKLTRAVAMSDEESARHAFTEEAWTSNLVGSSGLAGSAMYKQAHRSQWTLVPTAPPLMVGPDVALVPCSVETITDHRVLDRITAVVVLSDVGWRIHGAGENDAQVRALADAHQKTDGHAEQHSETPAAPARPENESR